jgi:ABC-2 type transport system permease protein
MLGALLYLRFTSLRNWTLVRLRRLRQPKYLLGALVGIAYFYFFFVRGLHRSSATGIRRLPTPEATEALELANATLALNWLPVLTALAAMALLLFITLMWVVPAQRAALGFSEAEIAFLFPAPITRRALVHFRLLSSQFRSLLGGAVMMLFSNRWTMVGGNALTHAIGWWFIFSALNLHFSGANFTLTRLTDSGVGSWRRRLWVLTFVVAMIGLSLARLPAGTRLPELTQLSAGTDLRLLGDWAVALTSTAPFSWLLWPFKIVLAPFLAPDVRSFFVTLPPALAIITLHYLWVVRSAVAFEDATVEYAQKRSARIAAWRSGDRRLGAPPTRGRAAPFRLAGAGRPEWAFLWKNLLSTWQYFNLRVLLFVTAAILGLCIWLDAHPTWRGFLPGVSWPAIIFGAYTLIVGPQFARQDIRSDLAHADVLKTYPLAGWQIVVGELLTPVVILSAVLWLSVLTVALTFNLPGTAGMWITPQLRIAAAFGAAVIVPPLVTLQLLVPNAAALFFPAWFQLTRTRGGGPEVIGQRMIFFFAQLVTMAVALFPPAAVASLLIFILQALIGPIVAITVAAAFMLTILLGEIWCGIWLLGDRFEKLDLSADLRT